MDYPWDAGYVLSGEFVDIAWAIVFCLSVDTFTWFVGIVSGMRSNPLWQPRVLFARFREGKDGPPAASKIAI